jgi:AcrR family transcriptional regulator
MSRSAKTSTRLDPAVRRAQIIDAAAATFHGRDPSMVSLEEVAEAAGVSRSLVYAYFGDRGGLIAAVYLRNVERLDLELGQVVETDLPDEIRLRGIVRRYLEFARDNSSAWHLMAATGGIQHPAVQATRRQRIERIAAAWGGAVEARLLARGVIGLLEAAAMDWLEYQDCELDRATEVLFGALWSGLSGLDRHDLVLTAVTI